MGSRFSSFYCPSSSAPRPPPLPLLSPSPQIKHDVFLSFRGEDTRYNFITHLHKALVERGINTFIDYDLNRGDEISPALLTAIEESRISIIIFSKNYASSRWCLEELMKILECKNRETNEQIVIPVFYRVTPSDLRNQTGSLADAFAKHEKRFKQNLEQVHRWKDALKEAANLSGWTSSSDKSEAEFIEVIVEGVCQKLDYLSSPDTSDLVGIDSKIKEIEYLLCMGTNDVCSVGIWGIGGVGKTTIAEAVFNKISHQFQGCSHFAYNVREQCEQSNGLNRLRQELLSKLLGDKHANGKVYATGRTLIKNRFGRKKLLIAFDDVSDFRQIEGLIGGFDCLGPQSRIIITTRDKQVLENCEVNQIYKVQGLIDHEALELFHRYAFRRNRPIENYTRLSERVVKYARGIPLALKVLGSHLYKKNIEVWESQIGKMGSKLHMDIYEVLKISYDGLEEEEKKIFLDIACFFKWSDIEHVKSVLNACDFHTMAGIDVLLYRSLITISNGKITMHDLLEEMAKEIVRQESEDPKNRSRLWNYEEIYDVLTKNKATETIEGIALDMSKIRDDILLNPCDFRKMSKLRILKFYNSSFEGMNRLHVSQGLEYTFPALRYLSWHGCRINSPLSSFALENLVILNMRESKVEQLWNGVLPLPKLKEVDLRSSLLTSCPDFSGFPNLKKLDLSISNFCEISPSIARLNELELLDLSWCIYLKTIPDFSGLISLRELCLLECFSLEMLHELPCNLEKFLLSESPIEELPLSFGNLSRLQSVRLYDCHKLKRLPSSIGKLKSLKTLYLFHCLELDQLPEDIGCLSSLEILSAEKSPVRQLPSSIKSLKNLKKLSFRGLKVKDRPQIGLELDSTDSDDGGESLDDFLSDDEESIDDFINDDGELLDDCFSTITKLRFDLSKYMMFKCLPKLQLGGRRVDNYTVVEVLSSLAFQDCTPMADFEDIVKNAFHALQIIKKASVLLFYPGSEVPKWFNFQSSGGSINVEISPNWLNKSFMGFAFCFVVSHRQDHEKDWCGFIYWTCKVILKDGQSFSKYRRRMFGCVNHVYVKCPFLPFSTDVLCDAKEISFKIETSHLLDNQFSKKCGVHLMHAQYIEEADESSQVGEDEILSLANIHHNYEDVDQSHPKRLKKAPY